MTRPVFFITLGAIAGAVVGVMDGGGGVRREIGGGLLAVAAPIYRLIELAKSHPRGPAQEASADDDGAGVAHSVFSGCLRKRGADSERTLRDLLEFHEHEATVALVGCLLESEPRRFCTLAGRQQAADAMEIYLWSRDDAQRTSPAHGLAAKIHLLDRAAPGDPPQSVDPFALSWSGPADRAIFEKLKGLVQQGFLDAGAFAFSGRAELREAVRDVRAEAEPCGAMAAKE